MTQSDPQDIQIHVTLEELLHLIPAGRKLRIDLTTFWVPPGRPGVRLSTVDPGAPRRRAITLCPAIMADEGQTHADLLEIIAGALRRADELADEHDGQGQDEGASR